MKNMTWKKERRDFVKELLNNYFIKINLLSKYHIKYF